jgi:hypothetical protein
MPAAAVGLKNLQGFFPFFREKKIYREKPPSAVRLKNIKTKQNLVSRRSFDICGPLRDRTGRYAPGQAGWPRHRGAESGAGTPPRHQSYGCGSGEYWRRHKERVLAPTQRKSRQQQARKPEPVQAGPPRGKRDAEDKVRTDATSLEGGIIACLRR